MTAPRKRAFIVMDLEGFDGDAADLAMDVATSMPNALDLTVYASLDDLLHDKAAKLDIFQYDQAPIRKPPEEC